MKKKRSFLKWAGGKYALVDEIYKHLPEADRLIEPFVGAGSVFLNTHYDEYQLSDINNDLITLYNIVKFRTEEFVSDVRSFFTPLFNDEKMYYDLREQFNRSNDVYLRSILFLYLNRHGYNGLCRYNRCGFFNVPFGKYAKTYFPEEEIINFAEKAQKATFCCQSYDLTMLEARAGTVVYCDPPYAPLSLTANFTDYHSSSFNYTHQIRLGELAEYLSDYCQIPVIISNNDTPLTRLLYKNAVIYNLSTYRSISGKVLGRSRINEILAIFSD